MFDEGAPVRDRTNPAHVGFATGRTREAGGRLFHKVKLATGGEKWLLEAALEVLVEEADALADARAARFSPAESFAETLTHIRLTGGLSDLIYSMESTNTEFHAYQFKPVIKILNAASKGLLIADEVGLGKTIEAGLIWTELAARYDLSRLLVVCPKSLQEKWRMELSQKFSVRAQAVDAKDLLATLKEHERTGEDFALVVTLSGVRAPDGWDSPDEPTKGPRAELARYLSAAAAGDPLFDLIIFDEAHHLRNAETMQHRTAQLLIALADYKLMLSATPINLKSEDLRSILRLLEPDLFERAWVFDELQAENAPLVAAREVALRNGATFEQLKMTLAGIEPGQFLIAKNRLALIRNRLHGRSGPLGPREKVEIASELEAMSMLGGVVNRTRRRDVSDLKVERRASCLLWSLSEVERQFYEEASEAIRRYAIEAAINERFLLANSQRLLASCLPAAYERWSRAIADFDLDDPDVEDTKKAPGPLTLALGSVCGDPAVLSRLQASDSKLACLRAELTAVWRDHPEEKLIIFSSFRGTLDYLEPRLEAAGIRTFKLHGSVTTNRHDVLRAFQEAEGRAVLLTSEIGGEGLDLQFCRLLVNYDLPWNPMKVEQRIGRVDRIGQRSPSVTIFSLICEGTIEQQIYSRLYERLQLIECTLGGYEPILGDIVRELEKRLFDPTLEPHEAEAAIEQRAVAAEQRRLQEDEVEREAAGLIAHGDMILHRIQQAHEKQRFIGPEELYHYVSGVLRHRFPGTLTDRADTAYAAYDFRLSMAAQQALAAYIDQNARRYRTDFRRSDKVRVVFGKLPDGARNARVEVVNRSHPLVRFAAQLRKEAREGVPLRPVVCGKLATETATEVPPGRYGLVAQRWSSEGVAPQDRLVFGAVNLSTRAVLDPELAEDLAYSVARHLQSAPWPPDAAAAAAAQIEEALVHGALEAGWDDFFAEEAAAHNDKRETLLSVLRQQRDAHVRKVMERIDELRLKGGSAVRIIPAEQGKLGRYRARMDQRIADADGATNFSCSNPETHAVALVEVG